MTRPFMKELPDQLDQMRRNASCESVRSVDTPLYYVNATSLFHYFVTSCIVVRDVDPVKSFV
jgi:hypothetical protein